MTRISWTRRVEVPLEKAWALAGDFTRSPGPGIAVEVHERGNPASHGAGAERTITIGNVCVRERLERADPPRSFTYRILSGAPMKDYQATVEFSSVGSSTEIRWSAQLTPKFPGTGWILARVTKKAVNRYIDEVERSGRLEPDATR